MTPAAGLRIDALFSHSIPNQSESRRNAADSAITRQRGATPSRFDLKMKSGQQALGIGLQLGQRIPGGAHGQGFFFLRQQQARL